MKINKFLYIIPFLFIIPNFSIELINPNPDAVINQKNNYWSVPNTSHNGTLTVHDAQATNGKSEGTGYQNSTSNYPVINQVIPLWIRGIFILYAQNQISDSDLIKALQYLVIHGVIKIN